MCLSVPLLPSQQYIRVRSEEPHLSPPFFASQSLLRLLVRRAQRRRGWRSTQVSRALGHQCLPCAPVHVDWIFWNGAPASVHTQKCSAGGPL